VVVFLLGVCMIKLLSCFFVLLFVCLTTSHCSSLTEYPGQRSISDDSFTSNGVNLGVCWGDIVHSIIKAKKNKQTVRLASDIDKFVILQRSLCNGKGRDSMEWQEFLDRRDVIVSDLIAIQESTPTDVEFCKNIEVELRKLSDFPVEH
jgi:hypothetical protein